MGILQRDKKNFYFLNSSILERNINKTKNENKIIGKIVYKTSREKAWAIYQAVVHNTKYQRDTERAKIDKIVDLCVFGETFIR